MEEITKQDLTLDLNLTMLKIGDVIRSKRKSLDMTQQTLAFMILSDKSLISEIERGAYKNISVLTLLKLSKALDLELKDFF